MKNYYVIFDCDPGIDDAVAIMNALNSQNIEVLLISTVSGNLNIEQTTRNALKLVELFNKDVPVSMGANAPLTRECVFASVAQGTEGLGGYQFPDPNKKAIELKGEDAIYYYLKSNPAKNTTLLCTGSMTNIAKLLTKYQDAHSLISRIVFMGGSKDENGMTIPYREFNVAFDPEAMEIVINAGLPLIMVPMELGHFSYLDHDDIEKIKKSNEVGNAIYQMFTQYKDFHVGHLGAATHDSCAAMYVTNPEIFKTEEAHISLHYYDDGDREYGYIYCDFHSKNPNATVCVDIDVEKFKKILFGNLFNYN